MAKTVTIQIRKPHSAKQARMIDYPGNVAALCGRRFGKTDAYVQRLYRSMQRQPGLYWWIGLSWQSASMKRAWRITSFYARQVLRAIGIDERGSINRSTHEISIPGMGAIWFRTAENPGSLAGEGIRGAVVDEFTLMDEIVWTEFLEATLLDYGGWVAFGGVPKGNNWSAALWRDAASRSGWLQIQASTYENPFIKRARIDEMRSHTSEDLFRQEYLAEIVAGGGSVFRRVTDAATAQPLDRARPGRQYIMGVDWGQSADFTVIVVVDAGARAVVALDRFNQIDYVTQRGRLTAAYERFRPDLIIAELNAMGQPIAEQLAREGLPIQGFVTTNATKAAAIDALALAFERGAILIPNDQTLVGELQAYEMKRTATGLRSFSAPAGMHDDCVMALALAWSGIANYMPAIF